MSRGRYDEDGYFTYWCSRCSQTAVANHMKKCEVAGCEETICKTCHVYWKETKYSTCLKHNTWHAVKCFMCPGIFWSVNLRERLAHKNCVEGYVKDFPANRYMREIIVSYFGWR